MKSNCPRLSRLATWAALIALTISCHSRALAEDGAEDPEAAE